MIHACIFGKCSVGSVLLFRSHFSLLMSCVRCFFVVFQILFCSFAYSFTTNIYIYIYIYISSKTSLVYLRFWYRKTWQTRGFCYFFTGRSKPVFSLSTNNFLKSGVFSNDDLRGQSACNFRCVVLTKRQNSLPAINKSSASVTVCKQGGCLTCGSSS